MTPHLRTRLRAASAIHQQYAALSRHPVVHDPPTEHWQRLETLWRQLRLCEEHQLSTTRDALQERYLLILEQLGSRCRSLVALCRVNTMSPCPSLRFLAEELVALEQEFPEVRYHLAEKVLSVITEPITLDEIELGPFEIRLNWTQLALSHPYEVLALQPHPAGDSRDTTHPHVHDRILCEGEAREAIRLALDQGRLCDLCLLISRVLHTYNPGSAYTKLSEWDGIACPDCGSTHATEDFSRCEQCDDDRCEDCLTGCRECHCSLCSSCEQLCDDCQEPHCAECLENCAECARTVCSTCRTDALCGDCHDLQQESDDDETDLQDQTTAATPAPSPSTETVSATDTDIHSDGLGEALLPA